ncbi:MAG: ABC transporter ATP-binding protein, partial [Elusimicrobia bacterium]|nr:ABC transporter ATP-binding protein [Elusimicrobiota bacterium]
VLVTHDRYLLERVCPRILALDGRGGTRYFADLSQWERWKGESEGAPEAPEPRKAPISNSELKELRGMEAAIHSAEKAVEKARLALEDPAVAADAQELLKRHGTLDAAQAKVDALFARWQELEARKS